MIVYFLPGVGRYGGIKVGFQFAELLRSLGVPVVVATPGGEAPRWFRCSVPVVVRESAIAGLGADDVAIFSLPHDHAELRHTPARLVFHCQGTDPLIDDVLHDRSVHALACWRQAHEYIEQRTGRAPIDVGISISDCFFDDPTTRVAGRIAYMPRRGAVDPVLAAAEVGGFEVCAIDGDDEDEVAAKLRSSDVFVAVAEGEWFGLPALEAMASGCSVLSVPVLGGTEYLHDGESAWVRPTDSIADVLVALLAPERAVERDRIRARGRVVAGAYRRSMQREHLRRALAGRLGEVLR